MWLAQLSSCWGRLPRWSRLSIAQKDKHPFSPTFTPADNLDFPICLACLPWDCGREAEDPQRAHADTGRPQPRWSKWHVFAPSRAPPCHPPLLFRLIQLPVTRQEWFCLFRPLHFRSCFYRWSINRKFLSCIPFLTSPSLITQQCKHNFNARPCFMCIHIQALLCIVSRGLSWSPGSPPCALQEWLSEATFALMRTHASTRSECRIHPLVCKIRKWHISRRAKV